MVWLLVVGAVGVVVRLVLRNNQKDKEGRYCMAYRRGKLATCNMQLATLLGVGCKFLARGRHMLLNRDENFLVNEVTVENVRWWHCWLATECYFLDATRDIDISEQSYHSTGVVSIGTVEPTVHKNYRK